LSWQGPPNIRFDAKAAADYLADDYPEAPK
jgi:hypothetical protein